MESGIAKPLILTGVLVNCRVKPQKGTQGTKWNEKWKMEEMENLVGLRAKADKLKQSHGGAEDDPANKKPRLRAQPLV